jgi:hypothetical protein
VLSGDQAAGFDDVLLPVQGNHCPDAAAVKAER